MADGQRQQHGTGPDAIQGWMREGADLAQRSMQVVQQLQRDWDGMAVNDRSWSTDTIMNEVVNSWEHFTPVMGDWIQYGVDGMGIALRSFWPQGPDMLDEMSKRVSQAPNGADAAEYLSVSADAARRMAASSPARTCASRPSTSARRVAQEANASSGSNGPASRTASTNALVSR